MRLEIRDNVEIDVCAECGGIYLDAGELEQLVGSADASWFRGLVKRPKAATEPPP